MSHRLLQNFLTGIWWTLLGLTLLANTPLVTNHWHQWEMEKIEQTEKGKKDLQEEEDSKRKYTQETLGYALKDPYYYSLSALSAHLSEDQSQHYLEILTPPPEA